MKTFDAKQTSWEGLWFHPETNGYISATFNLSKLKQFKGTVRMYVRKNKFYNSGENGRPNYVFCIKDSDSETFSEVEVIDDRRTGEWIWTERLEMATIYEGYECSKCGWTNGYKKTRYCPDCGAMMINGGE